MVSYSLTVHEVQSYEYAALKYNYNTIKMKCHVCK